jgi:predicted Rossmann fold flavoprotein
LPIASNNWDTIIIGGGAAGLMAAASAAERGKKVLLLEKNKKIGVKILMSGGTRCNITHDCGIQGIIEAFGRNGKFLHSALAALPPSEVVRKIEAQGVATKVEATGKIFPASNKALDVRDALVDLASQAGATILNSCPVESIDRTDSGNADRFIVSTNEGNFTSKTVVITSGGKSYPGCGTTGDGYVWADRFGHSIVKTVPALTPVLSSCQWAHELKGITIEHVHVRVNQPPTDSDNPDSNSGKPRKQSKAKTISERTGSFLFTHWGFSGPAVLDVSREIARHPSCKSLELICDFLPEQSLEQLTQYLSQRKSKEGKQLVANLLNEIFPRRFADALLHSSGVDPVLRNADLSKKGLMAIGEHIKSVRFPINGTLGFEKAEVTSGGVHLKEVDGKTMESKLVEGLFFAGEILDLDGRIGGFNFQSAFSTGWLAGKSI